MNLLFDFGINVVMTLLLSATIFYCWLLNKRIQVLQDSKGELAKLLKQFDHSTRKASESIVALQTASKKISETIQSRIEKANYMMDDLNYIIDRAGKAADQIEAGIAIARQKDKLSKASPAPQNEPTSMARPAPLNNAEFIEKPQAAPRPTVAPHSASHQTPETLSQAINLAELVLGEPLQPKQGKAKTNGASGKVKTTNTLSSLQALIEKVAERKSDPVLRSNQKNGSGHSGKVRSQSEEELMAALRYNSKV